MLSNLWFFLLMSRAHFLLGTAVMYGLGVIIARADGASPDLPRLIWGQVGASAIQLMTHLVNEYHDAGRDALVVGRTLFSGGSGVLSDGRLTRRVAARGALAGAVVGLSSR